MKKLFLILICFSLVLSLFSSNVYAVDTISVPIEGGTLSVYYNTSYGGGGFYISILKEKLPDYCIKKCDATSDAVVLPQYINGIHVLTVGPQAFMDSTASTVVLPENYLVIWQQAFEGAHIKTIYLPKSLLAIVQLAFLGCSELTDVYYAGTEEEWNNIKIDNYADGNNYLLNADIHFESEPYTVDDHKSGVDSGEHEPNTDNDGNEANADNLVLDVSFWEDCDVMGNEFAFASEITKITNSCGNFSWNKAGKYDNSYASTDYSSLNMMVSIFNRGKHGAEDVSCTLSIPDGFSCYPDRLESTLAFSVGSIPAGKEYITNVILYPVYSDSYRNGERLCVTAEITSGSVRESKTEQTCYGPKIILDANAGKIFDDASNIVMVKDGWDAADFQSADANAYHHHLALMSAGLSKAAYNKDVIVSSLLNLGFSQIDTVGYTYSNNYKIAFVIGQKKIISANHEIETIVACVARGSTTPRDWLTDIDTGDGTIHRGFNQAATVILSELENYLGAVTTTTKILLTGHSYAAAAINLVAANLDSGYIDGVNASDVYAYTFATPNVTMDRYEAEKPIYQNIFNILYDADIATYVPSSRLYYDYGENCYFPLYQYENYDFFHTYANKAQQYYQALSGKSNFWTAYNYFSEKTSYALDYGAWQSANGALGGMTTSMIYWAESIDVAHSMYSYLAWLYSLDGVFSQIRSKKIVYVDCPVDVYVYDPSGTLVGRVVNDVVDTEIGNRVNMDVVGDSKVIYLSGDIEYSLRIVGNGDGKMDVNIVDYNDRNEKVQSTIFRDVTVSNGSVSTAYVHDNDAYMLEFDTGETVSPDYVFTADELDQNQIELATIGEGYVSGDGNYTFGEIVSLRAEEHGTVFKGWYDGDKLLSADKNYKFVCQESKRISAVFASATNPVTPGSNGGNSGNSGNDGNSGNGQLPYTAVEDYSGIYATAFVISGLCAVCAYVGKKKINGKEKKNR